LLDGGFSTQLSKYLGAEKVDADPLWTARSLIESPDTVCRVHRDFLAARARVLLTASYQASVQGFKEHLGLSAEKTKEAITNSALLAWRAVKEEGQIPGHVLVAGSIGPYGACLGDGSEYTGAYLQGMTREDLEEWHRPRMVALIDGKVSLLALETMPGSIEVLAALDCLGKASVILPAWVSFSIKDGASLCGGEAIEEAVRAVVSHPMFKSGRVVAIGVNCCNPDNVTQALTAIRSVTKTTPLVVYSNTGEVWDGQARIWRGEGGQWFKHIKEWVNLGALIIGGCCRVTADDLPTIEAEMINGLCA